MPSSKKYEARSVVGLWIFLSLLLTTYYLLPITSHAQEIDLLWQGDVYTPPFYEGRALWTNQSEITLYAVPHIPNPIGGEFSSTELVYKWWKNSTVLGTANGIGKNSITFTGSIIDRPQSIKIEILSKDGALLASATREFSPIVPSLLIYENNPLYGIMFNREVGSSYKMRGSEITLVAIPLFFSSFERDPEFLKYSWRTNAGGSKTSNSVTYRIPENTSGSSRVNIRVSNEDRIIQSSERSFLLDFNDNE